MCSQCPPSAPLVVLSSVFLALAEAPRTAAAVLTPAQNNPTRATAQQAAILVWLRSGGVDRNAPGSMKSHRVGWTGCPPRCRERRPGRRGSRLACRQLRREYRCFPATRLQGRQAARGAGAASPQRNSMSRGTGRAASGARGPTVAGAPAQPEEDQPANHAQVWARGGHGGGGPPAAHRRRGPGGAGVWVLGRFPRCWCLFHLVFIPLFRVSCGRRVAGPPPCRLVGRSCSSSAPGDWISSGEAGRFRRKSSSRVTAVPR